MPARKSISVSAINKQIAKLEAQRVAAKKKEEQFLAENKSKLEAWEKLCETFGYTLKGTTKEDLPKKTKLRNTKVMAEINKILGIKKRGR